MRESCAITESMDADLKRGPRNVVLLADALAVLPTLPKGHIDLTVFSPPYDGIRDYGKDWTLDYHTLGTNLFQATTDGGVCAVVIGDGTKNFAKSLTTFRWADAPWSVRHV
jgi:beta-glucosidase-like glycosyl hydrolase